jgi:hypothetical protein
MIFVLLILGISLGVAINLIFPKFSATLNGIGIVDKVVNKDRKFGSATEYLHFKVIKDGKVYHKLLTEKQFDSIQDRVKDNKEDLIK